MRHLFSQLFLALDWNPDKLYDSSGSCSTGTCANWHNFDLNEPMSPIAIQVRQYLEELDFETRLQLVSELRHSLHHWNPVIPIIYPMTHWSWSKNVQGIDPLLFQFHHKNGIWYTKLALKTIQLQNQMGRKKQRLRNLGSPFQSH